MPRHPLRRLALLLCLVPALAAAGFGAFTGTGSRGGGTGSGGSGPLLPTTFAWYGDSIAAGACSATAPTAALQSLLGSGWAGSADAGDGTTPAVGGYSAAQIRARYNATRDTACLGERCGTYIIEGGVNSAINNVSAANTLTDMVAIIDDLRGLTPKPRIVWFSILPFRGAVQGSDAATTRALAYNALMEAACASRTDVECVMAYGHFEDPENANYLLPAFTCDGIHLLQAGTDLLAQMAYDVLE